MRYDLFDAVARSIMNHEPMVVVEGKDDYQIYQTIADSVNPAIQVYQVNEFENYAEGCEGVIDCIAILQPKFEEREDVIHKVLGIIDRDVRPYRDEVPDGLRGLFITKYYSIETYFATEKNLGRLIEKITHIKSQDIDDSVIVFVKEDFTASLDILYLMSLEALKNAYEEDYNNLLGYGEGYSGQRITSKKFQESILPELNSKKEDLAAFANSFELTSSDIKLIAKGKWYLYWYLHHTYPKIKKLKEKCRNGDITQCRSCKAGNHNHCLFKTKQTKYNIEILYFDMLDFIDEMECSDIIEVLQTLN